MGYQLFKAELNRETVGEQVVLSLRNAIVSGTLTEGETLTESALSKELGTSRSPIREAMQQLRREGLIVSGPNRTMVVASLDDDDIAELYEYRTVLETFAIGKVCRLETSSRQSVVDRLEEAIDKLRIAVEGGDEFEISNVDLAFHSTLIESAGNRRLSHNYQGLKVEFLTLINRLETFRPSGNELIDDHRQLIDAIRDGDADQGAEFIESHLNSACANLMRDRNDKNKLRSSHNG